MNKVFAFIMSVLTVILSFFGINIGKPDPVDPPTETTTSIVETTESTTKSTTEPTTTTTTTKPTTTTTTTTTTKPTTTTTKPTTDPNLPADWDLFYHTKWPNMSEEDWKAFENSTKFYNKNHHLPDALEAEIYDRINWEREKAGVNTLGYNFKVYDLVATRAKEASLKWSHERPDGTMCTSVFKNAGVSYGYFGENLGKGYKTAAELIDGFMNSPSHKNCMLNSNYTSVTIAYYIDINNTPFYACIFTDN